MRVYRNNIGSSLIHHAPRIPSEKPQTRINLLHIGITTIGGAENERVALHKNPSYIWMRGSVHTPTPAHTQPNGEPCNVIVKPCKLIGPHRTWRTLYGKARYGLAVQYTLALPPSFHALKVSIWSEGCGTVEGIVEGVFFSSPKG